MSIFGSVVLAGLQGFTLPADCKEAPVVMLMMSSLFVTLSMKLRVFRLEGVEDQRFVGHFRLLWHQVYACHVVPVK